MNVECGGGVVEQAPLRSECAEHYHLFLYGFFFSLLLMMLMKSLSGII